MCQIKFQENKINKILSVQSLGEYCYFSILMISKIQLLSKQYYLQTETLEMKKGTYRPKIPRKKIPNLINISQKQISSNTQWPTFFSKIQNSLKLLQEPIRFDKPKQNKNKYLSYRQTISLRLKQLSKPKQRNFSLTQTQLISNKNKFQNGIFQNINQYSHPTTYNSSSKYSQKYSSSYKPISLPVMYPSSTKNKSYYSIQHKAQSQNLSRGGNNKTEKSIQEIAATTLLQKSFEQILAIHKQEVYKQFDQYLQSQSNQEASPPPIKLSPKQIQTMGSQFKKKSSNISQNQLKSPKSKRINDKMQHNQEENQSNNLTELSDMIIGGQPKIYEVFDKKLMEKIKVYRSRKPFKFNHQVMWK